MPKVSNIVTLTKEAKRFHAESEQAKALAEQGTRTALEKAWECGKRLNQIKETVGHSNWLLWLEGNWPELGQRTAQSYMKIDRDNPDALRVADLKFDSVRKYRIANYVPQKERPESESNVTFSKSSHHLTVVTECNKLTQRIDAGQYECEREELRRDFKPFYQWLTRLYSKETA